MADQALGTARVDIVVDTTQMQAEIARAKNLGASLGPEFEKSLSRMSASQRRASLDALRLSQQVGKTRDEIRLLSLGARGAAPEALERLRQAFLAARQEASGATTELNRYGISAKQQAAALRGVPAQLTDIMVSLQGGQAPLTVLLQQGGQLRDMFGGIVPAARALGSAALGLVNPLTVAGAAVAALAVAYHQGTSESKQFAVAIAESGNAAGQTAETLASIASRAGDAIGSQGRAVSTLAAVVSTGKVAASALQEVTEASAAWASATGQDASDVASIFAKLADEPAEAAAKLNEQYRFLTASVYEQIRALEDQGRADDAAALAQRTLAQALKSRSEEVKAELGTLERAWGSVAGVARDAWDAMLNVGRQTPTEELRRQAAELQRTLDDLQANSGFQTTEGGAAVGGGGGAAMAARRRTATELAAVQQEIANREREAADARSQALKQQREQEKIAANREIADLIASTRTKEEIRRDELAKLQKQLQQGLISEERYEQGRRAIIEKYRDTGSRGSRGPRDDAAARLLAQYREGEAALRAQAEAGERLGTWQRRSVELEQQLADLKEKRVLTADQQSLLARQDELRAALARNVAEEQALKLAQERARTDALTQSLGATLANDRQQYADQLGAFGRGAREREELQAQQRLYRENQRLMQQAARDLARGQIGEDTYRQQTEALRRNLDERLAAQQDYFDQLRSLEGDWTLGAQGGLADYADEARNVADATRSAFSSAFQGAEEALAEFVTTGKASFSDLARSILADLARIALRQSITGPLASALGSVLGGVAGGFSSPQAPVGGYIPTVDVAGGLASGGPALPNRFYEVNEQGPELFTTRGRTYLMSGADGGYVTPVQTSALGGASGPISISVVVNEGNAQTRTEGEANDMGSRMAEGIRMLVQQEIARSYRQGGRAWQQRNGRA